MSDMLARMRAAGWRDDLQYGGSREDISNSTNGTNELISNRLAPMAPATSGESHEHEGLKAVPLPTSCAETNELAHHELTNGAVADSSHPVGSSLYNGSGDAEAREDITESQNPEDALQQEALVLNYLRADFFDNGTQTPGRAQFKCNVHINYKPGEKFTKFGMIFHSRSRDFVNTLPVHYQKHAWYLHVDKLMQNTIDERLDWQIKPTAGKFRDPENKVIPFTAGIMWQVKGQPIHIYFVIEDWTRTVVIDQEAKGKQNCKNLAGWGCYQNEEMAAAVTNKPSKKSFREAMRDGNKRKVGQ